MTYSQAENMKLMTREKEVLFGFKQLKDNNKTKK